MKIPSDAVIPQEKLTQYLLVYKEIDDKSKFLAQVGFTQKNPQALVKAIQALTQRENAIHDLTNVYGNYYRVEGELSGPRGCLLVIKIWIAKAHSDGKFRFVTLKPKR